MKKRFMSAFLAVIMLFSMLSTTAFAASSEEEALVDYYYESAHLGGLFAKNLYVSQRKHWARSIFSMAA